MSIAAVNCDESGTIVAGSCDLCPYEFYSDEYYYDYYYNDGTFCKGDCSWNSDVDKCQVKGNYLIINCIDTSLYLINKDFFHIQNKFIKIS